MSVESCLQMLERKIDYHKKQFYFLCPKYNEIPAGGEHICHGARLVGLEEYRSYLLTRDPAESLIASGNNAHVAALVVMTKYIEKWNAAREYQVHRSTDFIHSFLLPFDILLSAPPPVSEKMRIILNPSQPLIWRLRYEDSEPIEIAAPTFQEALLAWWFDFGEIDVTDIPVDFTGGLGGILSFWIDDKQVTLQDITEEYYGLQSGDWLNCEHAKPLRRKPRIIENQEQAAAQAADDSKKREQARLLAQFKKLQAMMGE